MLKDMYRGIVAPPLELLDNKRNLQVEKNLGMHEAYATMRLYKDSSTMG